MASSKNELDRVHLSVLWVFQTYRNQAMTIWTITWVGAQVLSNECQWTVKKNHKSASMAIIFVNRTSFLHQRADTSTSCHSSQLTSIKSFIIKMFVRSWCALFSVSAASRPFFIKLFIQSTQNVDKFPKKRTAQHNGCVYFVPNIPSDFIK